MDAKVKALKTKQKHNMNKGIRRNYYTTVRMPSCKVCGGTSSGYHFGVITCEACKAFYRRALQNKSYSASECQHGNRCSDTPVNITTCMSCRLKRCLQLGMSMEGVRKGRYSVELRVKSIQEAKLEESTNESMVKVSKLIGRLPAAQYKEEFDINSELAPNNNYPSIHVYPSNQELKEETHIAGFNNNKPGSSLFIGGETGTVEHTADFKNIPLGNTQLTSGVTGTFDYLESFNSIYGGNVSHVFDKTPNLEHTVGSSAISGDSIRNFSGATDYRKHTAGFNGILEDEIRNVGSATCSREHTVGFNGILEDDIRNIGGSYGFREQSVCLNDIIQNNVRNVSGSSGSIEQTMSFNDIRNIGDFSYSGEHTAGFNDIPAGISRHVGDKTDTIQRTVGFSDIFSGETGTVQHTTEFTDISEIAIQHVDGKTINVDSILPLYSNKEQWSTSDTGKYLQHISDLLPTPETSQHVTALNNQWCYQVNQNIQKRDNHKVTTISKKISNIDAVLVSEQVTEKKDTDFIYSVIRQLIMVQGMLFPAFQVTDDIIREQTRIANEYKTWKTDYLFMSEPTNIVSKDVFKEVMNDFNVELDDRLVLFKNYAKAMEKNLVLYTSSSKYIPGFDRLEQDDVSKLLKASHVDFWLFTNCVAFNTHIEVSAGTDGVMNTHTEVLNTFFTKEYIDQVFSMSETLNKMNFTLQEISIIRAILLTFTDRCSLRRRDKVEHLQHFFVQCLRFHLCNAADKASDRFCKIMDRIVAARSITHLSSSVNEQVLKDWGFIMKEFKLWSEMMMFSCEL